MKKWLTWIPMLLGVALPMMSSASDFKQAIYEEEQGIPLLHVPYEWTHIEDVAQYKRATWGNVVGMAHRVSLEEAKIIADTNVEIEFFFYVKGVQMVLENDEVYPPFYRVFEEGDAVFFSGTPWWGSASDLADGFVKTPYYYPLKHIEKCCDMQNL